MSPLLLQHLTQAANKDLASIDALADHLSELNDPLSTREVLHRAFGIFKDGESYEMLLSTFVNNFVVQHKRGTRHRLFTVLYSTVHRFLQEIHYELPTGEPLRLKHLCKMNADQLLETRNFGPLSLQYLLEALSRAGAHLAITH